MCPILVYVAQFELQVFVGVFGNINSYHHSNYIYFKTHIWLHTQKKWIVLLKECNPNPNTSITKQSLVWHLTLWKICFSCYSILNKMTRISTHPMWLIWVLFFHLVNVLFDWLLKKLSVCYEKVHSWFQSNSTQSIMHGVFNTYMWILWL